MASSINIINITQDIKYLNEEKYQCNWCETYFPPKALLLYYFKILIGENLFHISKYEQSLQEVSRFVSHLITHNLDKPKQIELKKTCEKTSNAQVENESEGEISTQECEESVTECEQSDIEGGKNYGNWHEDDHEWENIARGCNKSDPKSVNEKFIVSGRWTEFAVKGKRDYNIKNYKCNECGEIFSKKLALYKHLKSHNGLKPFMCSLCGKDYNEESSLFKHYKRIHSGEKPKFQCKICDKTCWSTQNLRNHTRTHISKEKRPRPYKCDLCYKEFSEKNSLLKHNKIHTGHKTHLCTHCGKSFLTPSELTIHIRKHTGEKPYTCEHCGRSFITKQELLLHCDTHNPDRKKTFQCDICSKFFYTGSTLIKHKKTHTGERPYKCNHCDKAFSTNATRIRHERIHTGEKPYRCWQCDKNYSRPIKCCGGVPSSREGETSQILVTSVSYIPSPTAEHEISDTNHLF